MSEFVEAEQVYDILLKEKSEEDTKGPIYPQLGLMKQEQGEYAEAIAYYEKSIEIEEKQASRRDQNLAMAYNNTGSLHEKMRNYSNSKAHSCFDRAVEIAQHSLPANHLSLQTWRNNLTDV